MCAWLQVQVALSGYALASVWGGASANYSYPLYYDMGAPVQDHFLNWKVSAGVLLATEGQPVIAVQMMLQRAFYVANVAPPCRRISKVSSARRRLWV